MKKNYNLITTIVIVIIGAIIININKPLQMDELSTYFHCADKSLNDLVQANESGVNMMPPAYFYIMWFVDKTIGLNITTMRAVSLILGVMTMLLLNNVLKSIFNSRNSSISIITGISHCQIFIFSMCEARPYSLYLFLVLLLIKFSLNQKGKYSSITIVILNFIIPSTFYIGGVYCLIICAFTILLKHLNKESYKHYIISTFSGWILFLIFTFPTFVYQIELTYTIHFSLNNHLNINELFEVLSMQIFYPLSMVFIMFFTKTVRIKDLKQELINHLPIIALIITPIAVFMISKIFGFTIFANRYFIPTFIFNIFFISLLVEKFNITHLTKPFLYSHYLFCLLIFSYSVSSYAKAYSSESPVSSLSVIDDINYPVITQSRRLAFHLSHTDKHIVYQVVADQRYANHMKSFSKKLKAIPYDLFHQKTKTLLEQYSKLIYISGPWVNEDINLIKSNWKKYSVDYEEITTPRSQFIDSIFLLSEKS